MLALAFIISLIDMGYWVVLGSVVTFKSTNFELIRKSSKTLYGDLLGVLKVESKSPT